jgi:hypothetical protein
MHERFSIYFLHVLIDDRKRGSEQNVEYINTLRMFSYMYIIIFYFHFFSTSRKKSVVTMHHHHHHNHHHHHPRHYGKNKNDLFQMISE